MCCASPWGEQNSFDVIDAITVQERLQGVLVIAIGRRNRINQS